VLIDKEKQRQSKVFRDTDYKAEKERMICALFMKLFVKKDNC